MLDPQPINLKRRGKKNVTHKPTIEEQHFQQLKASGVLFYVILCLLSILPHSRVWFHIADPSSVWILRLPQRSAVHGHERSVVPVRK